MMFPKLLLPIALAALGWVALPSAQAATWLTLNPTHSFYTHDIIFEAGDQSTVTSTFGSRYFYEDSRRGAPAYPGLNSSGFYQVNLNGQSIPFQLQPYNSNNLRKLSASSTATASFVPGNYSNLALAIAAGNVGGLYPTLGYTLRYTDLSTSTGSFEVLDWGHVPSGNDMVEIFNVGRASGVNTYESVNNFSFFGVSLAVDAGKIFSSVDFQPFGMSSGEIGIIGFSALAVPEPSAVALGTLALGGIMMRRRREKSLDRRLGSFKA